MKTKEQIQARLDKYKQQLQKEENQTNRMNILLKKYTLDWVLDDEEWRYFPQDVIRERDTMLKEKIINKLIEVRATLEKSNGSTAMEYGLDRWLAKIEVLEDLLSSCHPNGKPKKIKTVTKTYATFRNGRDGQLITSVDVGSITISSNNVSHGFIDSANGRTYVIDPNDPQWEVVYSFTTTEVVL